MMPPVEASAVDTQPETHESDGEGVAENSLQLFQEVADAARHELANRPSAVSSHALASVNTLNDQAAIRSLLEINEAQTKDLDTLAKEPAIARIVVENNDG